MRRSNFLNLKNWRKLLGLLVILLLLVLGTIGFIRSQSGKGSDFKIGVLADDGVELISISSDRKMINVLEIDSESKLWIPGGLGWYRSLVIKKVLSQEGKNSLAKDIFFYNFGFIPDKVLITKNKDSWKRVYWLRYRLDESKMLVKKDVIKGDITLQNDLLNEIMVRDFAETEIVKREVKISVFNLSQLNGLAAFLAERFEWAGGQVTTVENISDQNLDKCLVKYSPELKDSDILWLLIEELGCDRETDDSLDGDEIDYYIDSNFGSMIKYSSYF